jgi:hypothetical protein
MPEPGNDTTTSKDLYEQYARDTNISVQTLKESTKLEEWVGYINIEDATTSQLCSYAGYTLAEIRSTSLQGRLP